MVHFHISHEQRFLTDRTFSTLSNIERNPVIVQLGTLSLYWMLHEILQNDRADCFLQLVDFSPSFFGIVANILREAHGRSGLYSIDWKEGQTCHIKYFSGKLTVELLKRPASQAGFITMVFCSA